MILFETNLILIRWTSNKLNNLTGHTGSSNNTSFTYIYIGERYLALSVAGIVSIVAYFRGFLNFIEASLRIIR